jgi:hypothetical protein
MANFKHGSSAEFIFSRLIPLIIAWSNYFWFSDFDITPNSNDFAPKPLSLSPEERGIRLGTGLGLGMRLVYPNFYFVRTFPNLALIRKYPLFG